MDIYYGELDKEEGEGDNDEFNSEEDVSENDEY